MAGYDFDLLTIGAGSGGVAASRRAAAYGARVAICEEQRVGGTCVLRGCVPKKLLVYGTAYRHDIEDAAGFGWAIGNASLQWKALVDAKDRELDRLEAVYHRMLRDAGVQLIEGRAHIVDRHTVRVGSRTVTARFMLVATGSKTVFPNIPGIEHGIGSDDALSLPNLPRRMLVVGGGYIGCELASVFNAAGAEVVQLVRSSSVLRGFDEDVRTFLAAEMAKRGVRLEVQALPRSLERNGDVLSMRLAHGDILETDVVLFATGRDPNSSGLGLEEVGVELGDRGRIVVDDMSRTSIDNIYAVGDVTSRLALTPVAIMEGRAVAETLFNGRPTAVHHDDIPHAVFAQPAVAAVGITESAARQRCGAIDVYRVRFRPLKHALSGRDEQVLMKLIVERSSDRVVGCHMVGEDAPEIVQGVAIAIHCGATKAQFDATVGIHPTLAEELTTMHDPLPEPESDDCL